MVDVRPMTIDDVDDVIAVVTAADAAVARAAGREPRGMTETQLAQFRAGMERFATRDPHGARVAVADGQVVGMAESIRRDAFWGLSMLFVHPNWQSRGVGRRLLDAALHYSRGATVRMILTSHDPRALRRYAMAGLAIHPAVEAGGPVDRSAIPARLPGREGGVDDLGLVDEVDRRLRGSRAEDVGFVLGTGVRMDVVDEGAGRGFVVVRDDRVLCLGATDEATAASLLWRALAHAGDEMHLAGLTAAQDWAVKVVLAAKLTVKPAGPLFVDGLAAPPGPWLPSGWYF